MFQKNYTIFCIIDIDERLASYTLFRLNDILDISLHFYIPHYPMSATKENKHSKEGAMHVVCMGKNDTVLMNDMEEEQMLRLAFNQ